MIELPLELSESLRMLWRSAGVTELVFFVDQRADPLVEIGVLGHASFSAHSVSRSTESSVGGVEDAVELTAGAEVELREAAISEVPTPDKEGWA